MRANVRTRARTRAWTEGAGGRCDSEAAPEATRSRKRPRARPETTRSRERSRARARSFTSLRGTMIAPFHIFPLKIAFPCKPAGEAASAKSLADRLLFAVTPHSSGTYVRTCVRTRARTTTCASAHVTKWAQGAQAAGAASGLDARAASARKRHWDTYRSNPSQDSTAMPRAQIRTYARTHCHVKDAGVSLPCEGFSTYVRTYNFDGRSKDARVPARSAAAPGMQEINGLN